MYGSLVICRCLSLAGGPLRPRTPSTALTLGLDVSMKRISTICFLVIASIASTPFESFLPVLATRPCDHATRLLVANSESFDDQRTNRSPLLDLVKTFQVGFILETVVGL